VTTRGPLKKKLNVRHCTSSSDLPQLIQFCNCIMSLLGWERNHIDFGPIDHKTLAIDSEQSGSEIAMMILTLLIINPIPLHPPVTTATYPLTLNKLVVLNDDMADVDVRRVIVALWLYP